jgi:CBS domain-containing protein
MVMLSDLRRFALVDGHGRRGRLADAAVDLSVGDYPPVTAVIVRLPDRPQARLPWEAIGAVDWRQGRMRVDDLGIAQPAPAESLAAAVLLRRDVVDALVIDLQNSLATRANDLWLDHAGGRLLLKGADTSVRAVVRRLSRGLLGRGTASGLLDWRDVEFLRGDPGAAQAGRDYHRQIARLPPGRIATLADALPYPHAAELVTLLPDPIAAEVLDVTGAERRVQIVEELAEVQAVRLLARMSPDVVADLLGVLDPDRARHYLEGLPPGPAARVVDLLRYPPDTAGGIMTNDIVWAAGHLRVVDARRELRERLREPDFVHFVYVVDDDRSRHLRGALTLRELLVAADSDRLSDLMRTDVVTLDPLAPAGRAALEVTDSHLAAVPVVDRDRRLLGAVTIDVAIAQVAPSAWGGLPAPRVFT